MKLWDKLKRKFYDVTLLKKLTLIYVVAILVPTFITGWYTYNQTQKYVENEVIKNIEKINEQLKNNVERKINIAQDIAERISYNSRVQKFLSKKFMFNFEDLDEYGHYINPVIDYIQNFNQDYVCDICLFITNTTIPESWNNFYHDARIKNCKWYKDFKQSKSNSTWFYHTKPRNFIIPNSNENDEVFTFVKKVYSLNNKYLGIIVINIFTKEMFSGFDNFYMGDGTVYVINPNYIVLYSTQNIDTGYEVPLLKENLVNDKGYFTNKKAVYYYQKIDFLNLMVVSKISISKVLTSSQRTSENLIYVIMMGLGVLEVLMYYIFKIIFLKMKQIVNIMNTVAEGNFDIQIPVQGKDEIGQLARNFNILIKKINSLVKELLRKEVVQKDAQIKALQYQINPHFIYNTLDIFRMKIIFNGDFETAEAMTDFGKMLRYNVSNKSIYTTLENEIEYVKRYFNLQRLRYNEKINLVIHLPENLRELKMLKFIFQPIIENSLKHGLKEQKRSLCIEINVSILGEDVIISIQDNGIGINSKRLESLNYKMKYSNEFAEENESKSDSIGLININNRLKLYYGNSYHIKLESEHFKYTKVIIKIPYK